jgi:hypothetical protein
MASDRLLQNNDEVPTLEVALSIMESQRLRIRSLLAKIASLEAKLAKPQPHIAHAQQIKRQCQEGSTTIIVDGEGDPCPRCGRPMQTKEHAIEPKHKLHYRRWYVCLHTDCQTRQVMPERFKVFS